MEITYSELYATPAVYLNHEYFGLDIKVELLMILKKKLGYENIGMVTIGQLIRSSLISDEIIDMMSTQNHRQPHSLSKVKAYLRRFSRIVNIQICRGVDGLPSSELHIKTIYGNAITKDQYRSIISANYL